MAEVVDTDPKQLDALVDLAFVQPQEILSQREKGKGIKLDNASAVAVKFMTSKPSRASTMVADPVVVRLCMKEKTDELKDADNDTLKNLLNEIKKRDSAIGGWTLIYDVRPGADDKRSTWRLAAEVRPSTVEDISWQQSGGGRVLCVDVLASGVFVGRQKKASRRHATIKK